MEIRGEWALVTGAAKRLGKSVALSLARAGASVVVHHGHSPSEAAETVAEIEALGVEAFPAQADLRSSAAIDEMFGRLEERCQRLGILVNSAASFNRQALSDIAIEDFDAVIDVNLRAPWLCLQRAVRTMLSADSDAVERGVVVNIADLTGIRSWPGYSHHGVSKAGLVHLTKIAARELAPAGVRVNCVVPGAILPPPGMNDDDPSWQRKVGRVPLGRSGEPEAVGDAVVFLVRNHFITGSVLMVDGGEHLLGGSPAEPDHQGGHS